MGWFSRRSSGESHSWFGLHDPFDPKYRIVTSGIVQPWILFIIRLIIALYTVASSLAHLIIYEGVQTGHPADQYYIYFTRLTFIGVTAYFSAVAFHTGFFVLSLRQLKRGKVSRAPWYPLQKWGKVFQFLHLWLFSTIITMPIVVTVVYWAFLADASSFADPFTAWSNVTFHILNTVFLLTEFIFGRTRLYVGYSILCIVILGFYLGMVYLVHDVQSIWVYNFFDPTKPNAKVAAFIVGILAAEVVVYFVMWGLIHMRDWIFPRGRGVRVIEQGTHSVVV